MACGVSQQLVSLIERGHSAALSLTALRRVAASLEMRVALRAEWRGGELDRLLDADHAVLQATGQRWLARLGWRVEAEVTFSRYGERGSIDLLAIHPPTGSLLVVEVKTVVADLQSLLRGLDAKARLGRAIARERGWEPRSVVPCLFLAERATNRRRLAASAPLLSRYSLRAGAARDWLRRPGPAAGLLIFLTPSPTNPGGGRRSGRQRMRRPRAPLSVTHPPASRSGRSQPA